MDTQNETTRNNNFIYALGLICLLSIFSSEIEYAKIEKDNSIQQATLVSDCKQALYFLI